MGQCAVQKKALRECIADIRLSVIAAFFHAFACAVFSGKLLSARFIQRACLTDIFLTRANHAHAIAGRYFHRLRNCVRRASRADRAAHVDKIAAEADGAATYGDKRHLYKLAKNLSKYNPHSIKSYMTRRVLPPGQPKSMTPGGCIIRKMCLGQTLLQTLKA